MEKFEVCGKSDLLGGGTFPVSVAQGLIPNEAFKEPDTM